MTSLRNSNRLQFRAGGVAKSLGAVDRAAGRIIGVSLLTADREATGWGFWIDRQTVEGFRSLLAGRKLKAYATHGSSAGFDSTLDEVGYWAATRIEGRNLRSDFFALDAWRKHAPAEFDTLFEMAEKIPEEFGASLSFIYAPVWVLGDGREVPTTRIETPAGGVEYDPPAPAGALRQLPSVRPLDVFSADFVETPAANDGLFSAGPGSNRRATGRELHGLARTVAALRSEASRVPRATARPLPAPAGLTGLARTIAALKTTRTRSESTR